MKSIRDRTYVNKYKTLYFLILPLMSLKDICVCANSFQLCPTLCDPMDCSLRSSSIHGILQARILEWVAISFSRGPSWPRDQIHISCVSCIGRWILYHWATWEDHTSLYAVIVQLPVASEAADDQSMRIGQSRCCPSCVLSLTGFI